MNDSILSVIIPCYNNGEYLIQLLECFKRQTSDSWEIIIVDDRSTDNTVEIVRSFSKSDDRIKIFKRDRKTKGSAVCRNIGFEKSCGKYISHIDADDLISDTFVENRIKFMNEHPEVDYATFIAKTFMDGDNLPTLESKGKTYGLGVNTKDLLGDFLSANYCFSVWCNVYRRASIQDMPWDERVKIYTDFSFIVPGILSGLKHAFAGGEIDYYYRTFPPKKKSINMCSNFIAEDKCESTLYLFDKTLKSICERDDYQMRKKQFLNFIILHFERIMKGRNEKQISAYVDLIKRYYPCDTANVFESIARFSSVTWSQRLYEVGLYLRLYRSFGERYRKNFIHALGKSILKK